MTVKDIRPALRAFLLADAPLAAQVAGRMFPGEMPQGEVRPSIVYSEISNQGDHHMQGPSGLAAPRIQLTAWAQSADAADLVGRLIKTRLDGARGVMGAGDAAVTVQGVFLDTARAIWDADAKLHGKAQDFFVWFGER